MAEESGFEAIREHYEQENLTDSILNALLAAGKDLTQLTPDDLAPIDQFHIGGKAATLELLKLAELQPGSRVLDAGGGIGGPARTLVCHTDCTVQVVDLSVSFCIAGARLTELTGLSPRVSFLYGNMLEIPTGDATFDVVWTQHSSMNIENKEAMYREFFRVLKPGGKLAMHEVVKGPESPLLFPVPWASLRESSFLLEFSPMQAVIEGAGFQTLEFRNVTDEAIAFWQKRVAALQVAEEKPLLGIHLLIGPEFEVMGRNIMRNLVEHRTRAVQGVFRKPG